MADNKHTTLRRSGRYLAELVVGLAGLLICDSYRLKYDTLYGGMQRQVFARALSTPVVFQLACKVYPLTDAAEAFGSRRHVLV